MINDSLLVIETTRVKLTKNLTCDGDGEQTALRGQVLRKSRDVINTAVVSLVGGLCSREQEVGRVIDSWLGVVCEWRSSAGRSLLGTEAGWSN
ncbi:hypothetical protein F7725_012270 [Dissostichus mawsoni]|uniref:Uncharacterized protein n=1 Tax=Dissostichus mawsoni TaxID=36200 RepID=A0A7J5YQE4_DISMA|nr:hypothetical protein F7725_012270 [Dissostichus mawsoni]